MPVNKKKVLAVLAVVATVVAGLIQFVDSLPEFDLGPDAGAAGAPAVVAPVAADAGAQ
jgi:hypothetical protein